MVIFLFILSVELGVLFLKVAVEKFEDGKEGIAKICASLGIAGMLAAFILLAFLTYNI